MENSNRPVCLGYVEQTGKYIRKLRSGYSYDDASGLMIENSLLIKILYATKYNFRTMNSFAVANVLRNYFLGFERLNESLCDIDCIKHAVCELCD